MWFVLHSCTTILVHWNKTKIFLYRLFGKLFCICVDIQRHLTCSLGTAAGFRKFLFCLSSEKRSLQTPSCKCPRLQATAVQQCSNVTRWKLNDVTGHVIVCTARKNTLTRHRFTSKSTAAEAEYSLQHTFSGVCIRKFFGWQNVVPH